MTTEIRDYETLEDRALDALVAERVMGLTVYWHTFPDSSKPWPLIRGKQGDEATVRRYSTEPGVPD